MMAAQIVAEVLAACAVPFAAGACAAHRDGFNGRPAAVLAVALAGIAGLVQAVTL